MNIRLEKVDKVNGKVKIHQYFHIKSGVKT